MPQLTSHFLKIHIPPHSELNLLPTIKYQHRLFPKTALADRFFVGEVEFVLDEVGTGYVCTI